MRKNTVTMICLSAAIMMTAAQGCSIKEDRRMCPCLLTVSAGCPLTDEAEIRIGAETETVMPFEGTARLEKEVGKGYVRLCVVQGHSRERVSGDILTIPEGSGSDRMFLWAEEIDCTGETACAEGPLRKEFAELTVTVRELPEGEWSMEVDGSTAGYDLSSGQPVAGKLTTLMDSDGGDFRTVLPRQTGEVSLVLRNGGLEDRTYGLSGILEDAGYSWREKDLDDIRIEIEYGWTSVTVTVTDWRTGETTDIVI